MKLHDFLLRALVVMALAGTVLVLDQIWVRAVPWEIFLRLVVTLVILAVLDVFLILVRADFAEHKKLKDDNYLD